MAQRISVDRLETDGRRQVMSTSKNVSLQGVSYSICLKVYDNEYSRNWLILVASFRRIQENGILLIKLGNGDVLEFPCNNLNVGDVTVSGFPVKYYSSVYKVNEDELDKISKYGIIKMRITDGLSYREKNWKKDKLGKYLSTCMAGILYRLENYEIKKKNIYDNF